MSFLIAFAVALLLTPLLTAVGARFGLVDRPGHLKIHDRPIPVTGGLAVALAASLAIAVGGPGEPWILAAVGLGLLGGLVDDVRPLAPWMRLVVQAAAGTILVAGGSELQPLGALGGPGLILATMACCNAVNMIDGQDGLAAALGSVAALGLGAILASFGEAATVPVATAGGLTAFLLWNRPPARVFLGDSGAYAVGVLLAVSAAQVSAVDGPGLLAAGACLGVFAYELLATIVRRLASSAPASAGDRRHSYDRLAGRLRSRGRSTLVMCMLGVICSFLGLVVSRSGLGWGVALIVAATVLAAAVDGRMSPRPLTKEGR